MATRGKYGQLNLMETLYELSWPNFLKFGSERLLSKLSERNLGIFGSSVHEKLSELYEYIFRCFGYPSAIMGRNLFESHPHRKLKQFHHLCSNKAKNKSYCYQDNSIVKPISDIR